MSSYVEVSDSQPVAYAKGSDQTTSLALRQDGSPLTILTATAFDLRRPDGTVLFSGVPTITLGVADMLVTGVSWDTPTADPLGRDYTEAWTVTWEAGQPPFVLLRPAFAVAVLPFCPLTDQDLERMHAGILSEAPDGTETGVPADVSWAGKRLQAWKRLQARLQQTLVDPTAILSWYSFLDYLAYDTLWLIASDLSTEERGQGKWSQMADRYFDLRDVEWGRMGWDVSRSHGFVPDKDGPSRVAGDGYLGQAGGRRW